MNTSVIEATSAATHAAAPASTGVPVMRSGTPDDARGILALIEANLASGHLLPRTLDDLRRNAGRFVIFEHEGRLVGCGELAPLSRAVAEVRSLVIDDAWRGNGLGARLIEEIGRRAREADFSVLCAFAHDPHHFVRLGFSIVPHIWFPEKVALDCTSCVKFRSCGQYGLALGLSPAGAIPTLRQLREPIGNASSADARTAAMRPVRLRVIS